MMFIIMLAVELPLVAIHIALLYRTKVVKMKTRTKEDFGDISKYLQAKTNYRYGNYEYGTIRKKEDIKIAHQEGKKFVFTKKLGGSMVLIWVGIFFAIFGLIFSIILRTFTDYDISNVIIIINSFFSGLGAVIAIPHFYKVIRLHKSFIVIGQKGFIKSSIWGILRAYSWKDVDVKAYFVRTTTKMAVFFIPVTIFESPPTMQINILLPRGGIIKIEPGNYDLREYFSLENITKTSKETPKITRKQKRELTSIAEDTEKYSFGLFALTFRYFYDLGKYGASSIKLENSESAEIEKKERLIRRDKERNAGQIIYNFLLNNKGKAFTMNSLCSKCFELQQLDIENDDIIRILRVLYSSGRIGMEVKENEVFYHIR